MPQKELFYRSCLTYSITGNQEATIINPLIPRAHMKTLSEFQDLKNEVLKAVRSLRLQEPALISSKHGNCGLIIIITRGA